MGQSIQCNKAREVSFVRILRVYPNMKLSFLGEAKEQSLQCSKVYKFVNLRITKSLVYTDPRVVQIY